MFEDKWIQTFVSALEPHGVLFVLFFVVVAFARHASSIISTVYTALSRKMLVSLCRDDVSAI